jgi:flagellar motor switch protein FliM
MIERVAPYDFKHSQRAHGELMRAFRARHERLAPDVAAGLSEMLHSMVQVRLARLDQLTYREFVFSLENPTCFNVVQADAGGCGVAVPAACRAGATPAPKDFSTPLVLEMGPSILYPILDRLLGGGRGEDFAARRPLTEIELRIVTRVTGLFLDAIGRAWENVPELKLQVARVESSPQLAPIMPPDSIVAVIRFEVALGEIQGTVNLCIPYDLVGRICGQISTPDPVGSDSPPSATPEGMQRIGQAVRGSLVHVAVRLATAQISAGELIGLRVGDIIATEKDVRTPVDVFVENVPKFRARPGALKGRKAICIEEAIQ